MTVEGDNDVVARVDGIVIVDESDGADIEDGFVIGVVHDVMIDFDVRIGLGGFDEKTDRDEMVDADVKSEAGAWVGAVSSAELAACVVGTGVVTEIFVGVRLEGDTGWEIAVEVGA